MKKTLFILFGFSCVFLFLEGQNPQKSEQYKNWYKEAEELYKLDEPTVSSDSLALELFRKSAQAAIGKNDYDLASECLVKVGNIHQTYKRYTAANEYYHSSLQYSRLIKNQKLEYEGSLYLGSSLYFSNIIDSAQYYFEAASAIAFNLKKGYLPDQVTLYNSLGAIYFESANYLQAKNYFEKALLVLDREADEFEELFVGFKSNIANCFQQVGRYDSALKIYKELEKYSPEKEISEVIKQNTAHTYFKLGKYDSALLLYKQINSDNSLNKTKALNDIGRIYLNKGEWQQSEIIFDSAIALNRSISATLKNKEEAKAYLYRGLLAENQGLTDEALTWYNEALQEIHLSFKWKNVYDLPEDVSKTVSPITLFDILKSKATLLYKKFKKSSQNQVLYAALRTYRTAINAAEFIKRSFDNDEAKLFFNSNHQHIYRDAINAAHESCISNPKYFDDYIFILDNYKGSILYQNLQEVKLKSSAGIPHSIKKKEKELKQLLAFYTSRINNNTAEKDAGILQKRLLELQVELSLLQKLYEKNQWFNPSRNSTTENSLSSVQSEIDNETVLLNYFVADSNIYLLTISSDNILSKKLELNASIENIIRSYINEIYKYEEGKRYSGYHLSFLLYKNLIEPVYNMISGYEKWVIIPDGILHYIPFETLITDEKEREYLVEKRIISYHYSYALLLHDKSQYNDFKNNILSVAPFTNRDKNTIAGKFIDLPFSRQEIPINGSNVLVAREATKLNFLGKAPLSSLIHLATHASIGTDSINNWIQFYPADTNSLNNRLYIPEIYNMDLNKTRLVILSACETAGGIQLSGEGLQSLSRAFLYAGSDGIISTLWKTEDLVTAYLMKRLHFHLKNNSPEKSLKMAKIDLLREKNISSKYKTPNYWGNFIYTGKLSVQASKNKYWVIVIISGLLTLLLLHIKLKQPRKLSKTA